MRQARTVQMSRKVSSDIQHSLYEKKDEQMASFFSWKRCLVLQGSFGNTYCENIVVEEVSRTQLLDVDAITLSYGARNHRGGRTSVGWRQ